MIEISQLRLPAAALKSGNFGEVALVQYVRGALPPWQQGPQESATDISRALPSQPPIRYLLYPHWIELEPQIPS